MFQHLADNDLHAIRVAGQFLPLRALALNQVFRLLILNLHFRAHLLEADIERFLVNYEGYAVALVMYL
ncbi:hypothetical protein D3C81_1966500 [compost metagenome]